MGSLSEYWLALTHKGKHEKKTEEEWGQSLHQVRTPLQTML